MARKAEEAAAEKPAKRPRLDAALKRDTAATFNNLNTADFKLSRVTCLDVSSPSTAPSDLHPSTLWISRILPNLQEANFSNHDNGATPGYDNLMGELCRFCPALCRFILDGSNVDIFPPHVDPEDAKQVTELCLNGAVLRYDETSRETRAMLALLPVSGDYL